jgi:GDP-mannose transporter
MVDSEFQLRAYIWLLVCHGAATSVMFDAALYDTAVLYQSMHLQASLSSRLLLQVWYLAFVFDAVYVKHLCNTVQMTDWGRAYYTNLLSLVPMMVIHVVAGEYNMIGNIDWAIPQVTSLMMACVLGVAMSHSGYSLRRSVTATMMAMVGIVCKFLTVIVNCMIWDKHASPPGLFFLILRCVCAHVACDAISFFVL